MSSDDDSVEQGVELPAAADAEGGYAIGYGKPPKRNQFKKGASGNPNGRPKAKTKTLSTPDAFMKVFSARVKVTINGRSRNMNGIEAALWQLRNQMMAGNPRALRLFLDFVRQLKLTDKSDELNPQLQALVAAIQAGPVPYGEINEP